MSLRQRVARLEKDDNISGELKWLKDKYFELNEKIEAISSYLNIKLKKSNYVAEAKQKEVITSD